MATTLAWVPAETPPVVFSETRVFQPEANQPGELQQVEKEWFGPDGRRLRREIRDREGTLLLRFLVEHDADGNPTGATYYEDENEAPARERFTMSQTKPLRTIAYFGWQGDPEGVVEEDLNTEGKPSAKRYYRSNGEQYGREVVFYDRKSRPLGWRFERTDGDGGAEFRYEYLAQDSRGQWTERKRFRNGNLERWEVRDSLYGDGVRSHDLIKLRILGGSTICDPGSYQDSPSPSRDGTRLLFLRHSDDSWPESLSKEAFFARWSEGGWTVTSADLPVRCYTASFSSDDASIYCSVRRRSARDEVRTFRIDRLNDGWGQPIDLTESLGVHGSYLSQAADGTLYFFAANGARGPGLYGATMSPGEAPAIRWLGETLHPEGALSFSPFVLSSGASLLFTLFFEADGEAEEGRSGIYVSSRQGDSWTRPLKIDGLPYGWNASVNARGEFIFTDGTEILMVPVKQLGLGFRE